MKAFVITRLEDHCEFLLEDDEDGTGRLRRRPFGDSSWSAPYYIRIEPRSTE